MKAVINYQMTFQQIVDVPDDILEARKEFDKMSAENKENLMRMVIGASKESGLDNIVLVNMKAEAKKIDEEDFDRVEPFLERAKEFAHAVKEGRGMEYIEEKIRNTENPITDPVIQDMVDTLHNVNVDDLDEDEIAFLKAFIAGKPEYTDLMEELELDDVEELDDKDFD